MFNNYYPGDFLFLFRNFLETVFGLESILGCWLIITSFLLILGNFERRSYRWWNALGFHSLFLPYLNYNFFFRLFLFFSFLKHNEHESFFTQHFYNSRFYIKHFKFNTCILIAGERGDIQHRKSTQEKKEKGEISFKLIKKEKRERERRRRKWIRGEKWTWG